MHLNGPQLSQCKCADGVFSCDVFSVDMGCYVLVQQTSCQTQSSK